MDTNTYDFEQEDPEIIDTDFYKLQHELSCLKVKTQVSKMILKEQKNYLLDLQKSLEINDDSSSEEDEMEGLLKSMQNNLEKLYEERLRLVDSPEARDNLTSFVQSIGNSFHTRELEYQKHHKSFQLICEKQENSIELQQLNQLQANLDNETLKLDFLLVEMDQLEKEVAEKEKLDMKELQKMIIELTTFAVKATKHEKQEEQDNFMILKLENELSMLQTKEKALIDDEEDYLNDNVIQIELCQDKIPQFESIFKDPNDFPYLSSLTKIEDDKISTNENKSTPLKEKLNQKITVLQEKRSKVKSNEKPQKERIRKDEHSPAGSSKTSGKSSHTTKKLSPVNKSHKSSKIAPKKHEVSLIDKLPAIKVRKSSGDGARDKNKSDLIESAMQGDENVEEQETPNKHRKRSVVPAEIVKQQEGDPEPKLKISIPIVSLKSPVRESPKMRTSTPKVSLESPVTSRKSKITSPPVRESPKMRTSTPKVSLESPVTSRKSKITSPPDVVMKSPVTSRKSKITSPPDVVMKAPVTTHKRKITSPPDDEMKEPVTTHKRKITSPDIGMKAPVSIQKSMKISTPNTSKDSPATTHKSKIPSPPDVSKYSPATTSKPKIASPPDVSMDSPLTIKKSMKSSTPKVSIKAPDTTPKLKILSPPEVSMNSPITTRNQALTSLRVSVASPTNKANIISVELLPNIHFGSVDTSINKRSSETKLVNVDNKKIAEVAEQSPKVIWKQKDKQTLGFDQPPFTDDNFSETSDMENLFNDDFDTCSVTSGTGSEIAFLSPNSVKSFNMDTSENEDPKTSKKNAFDFDSDPGDFPSGSLF